ncbi:MAG: AAA family ATPase [Bacteroidales bacterium]|nr:AAA family ATPase [Bacteroidales bacterium]
MEQLVGRKEEIRQLTEYYRSGRPEFVAVYGRRRVGKTFLVRHLFREEFAFEMSGSIGAGKNVQLSNFGHALTDYGSPETALPKNWTEAFLALKALLKRRLETGKRCVVFIDELPCLDTPKSGFMQAFEHFWNSWASDQAGILLIVCGSATSWMIGNLIDSHGGLHNRITHELHLSPFTLAETEQLLQVRGFTWSRLSILQIYGILGGVPYYLGLLDRTKNVEANVDSLFFAERGELRREYGRLYSSLFKDSEIYMKVIEILSSCKQGLTRKELAERMKYASGGTLTKVLNDLENCDFIRGYHTRDRKIKQKDRIYQLTDLYTLFYIQFCHKTTTDEHYWMNLMGKPRQNTWYGLVFERVCMLHIPQIKKRLGIDRIHTEYYTWRSRLSTPAAQIDLVLERADNLLNICEIKYSLYPYVMDKKEEMNLRNRIADFVAETGVRHGILPTLITTFGVRPNAHSSIAQVELTLEDLFEG